VYRPGGNLQRRLRGGGPAPGAGDRGRPRPARHHAGGADLGRPRATGGGGDSQCGGLGCPLAARRGLLRRSELCRCRHTRAGVCPVLAIVEGDARTGIMLAEQTLAGPVLLEAGAIRKLVTSDVLLPLDAVFYDEVTIAEASTRGREILSNTSVRGLIDVAASRRDGMRPLPTDSTTEADVAADSEGSQQRSTADDWVLPAVGGSGDDEVGRAVRSD